MSCFVSAGSGLQDSSLVDDELCGDLEPSVDGDPHIILQESCTVPCPGKTTTPGRGGQQVGGREELKGNIQNNRTRNQEEATGGLVVQETNFSISACLVV